MTPTDRIFVAGHRGMVGSAIVRRLGDGPSHVGVSDVDLAEEEDANYAFSQTDPSYVFLAAGVVGGIEANRTEPVRFLERNTRIELNVLRWSHEWNVKRLCFLGSSCIYPRDCSQPIKEEYLMTGPLEPTNSAYAMAKLAGIELLKAYRTQYGRQSVAVMPCNLYGPGDHYDLDRAHVLPALIRRYHEAKISGTSTVTLWGDGSAMREFMHVDDCARACVMLMDHADPPPIVNVGSGEEISIGDLASLVAEIVGYRGYTAWDKSKPNGTPRKLLDSSKARAAGWDPLIGLEDGIRSTYARIVSGEENFAERSSHR